VSAKIGVLRSDQDVASRPERQVKKSIALHLVRHALAFWVIKNKLVRLIAQREFVRQVLAADTRRVEASLSRWSSDRSPDFDKLLPPLAFYFPFSDLPLWLIRLYWMRT
jgi:hypothetical protein